LRSERQGSVLVGLLEKRIVEVLKADDFGVTTGVISTKMGMKRKHHTGWRRVDGRTVTALFRNGLVERARSTSPWTFTIKLTPSGRALAERLPNRGGSTS
jgi:hypothetical protein